MGTFIHNIIKHPLHRRITASIIGALVSVRFK